MAGIDNGATPEFCIIIIFVTLEYILSLRRFQNCCICVTRWGDLILQHIMHEGYIASLCSTYLYINFLLRLKLAVDLL